MQWGRHDAFGRLATADSFQTASRPWVGGRSFGDVTGVGNIVQGIGSAIQGIGGTVQQALVGSQARAQSKRDALAKAQTVTADAQQALLMVQAQERQTAMLIGGGAVLASIFGAFLVYARASGPRTNGRKARKRRGRKVRRNRTRRNR